MKSTQLEFQRTMACNFGRCGGGDCSTWSFIDADAVNYGVFGGFGLAGVHVHGVRVCVRRVRLGVFRGLGLRRNRVRHPEWH